MKKGKALVLGGGGFLGSHLVELLLSEGHAVVVVQRHRSQFLTDIGVECLYCDLNEINVIRQAMQGVDWVFHFAHTTLPQNSNRDPIHDVTSNVASSLSLLQACVENSVCRVIYASSGGTVYGLPQSDFLEETHPTNPLCSYGITKLMVEKYLALFHMQYALDYRVLRIANPYGERQRVDRAQGAIGVFLHKMLCGEPIEIWGDGSVIRDYIYVKDVARALYLAMLTDDGSERIFNIGSGRGVSLREIVATLQSYVGNEAAITWGPKRPLDVPRNVLSIARADRILGWKPLTAFEEGVAITCRHVKESLESAYQENERIAARDG